MRVGLAPPPAHNNHQIDHCYGRDSEQHHRQPTSGRSPQERCTDRAGQQTEHGQDQP